MKKKILFTLLLVSMLVCLFAISISATNYDTSRAVKLDNGETVPLYDANGNALSYYNNGTEIVADLTTNIFKWDGNGWLLMKDANTVSASSMVVINLQDPTLDSTASSSYGFNISFRNSTNLEYVYFSNVIKQFNGSYAFSNCDKMKVFEITSDSQLERFSDYIFYNNQVLESIHIPTNVTYITNSNDDAIGFISKCPNLKTVTFGENCKLETITRSAFYECTSLVNLTLPDGVKTIMRNAFRASGIINSPFTENSRCEVIGQHAFRNCDSLNNFIVPRSLTEITHESGYGLLAECDNVQLVTFGKYVHPENGAMTALPSSAFGMANIAKVVLPEGITHIGDNAFKENKVMKEIAFPNSVVTAGQRVFQSCTALETIVFGNSFKHFINTTTDHGSFTYGASNVKNIYLPVSFYLENPGTAYRVSYMFDGGGNVKFFYTGAKAQLESAIEMFKTSTNNATDHNGNFLNATHVDYKDYKGNEANYENGDYIIYGYNVCDAFYGKEHKDVGNACVINCERCDDYDGQMKKNPQHDYVTTIEYTNFVYVENYAGGIKTQKCQNEGCAHNVTPIETSVKPIISNFKGFSTPVDGDGLTFGYVIDYEALEEYVAVNGKSVELGVVVAGKSLLNGDAPLDEKGNVSNEKVIKISVVTWSNNAEDNVNVPKYTGVDFKITGDWSEVMNEELYMAGYLSYGDGYKYLNAGSSSDTADYTTYYTIINQGK